MASTPQILKTIVFTLGGTDFSEDVLDVRVVPTPGAIQTVRTLDGVTHQDAESEAWSLEIRMVLDWDTVRPGLASYLYTNKGDAVAFTFHDVTDAISTTKPALTGTVTLVAAPYGGVGNTFAEATVVLPMSAAPTVDTTA
jgi:hypothetical protein